MGAGRRVAVLGGGMAGVTAAWELSRPGWEDRFESITLYQRGWMLGGKGASTRDDQGRILEHGLHVWLGYYDNAFRVLRECYEELDRARTDPTCPVRTWQDAFLPAPEVGVFEHGPDGVTDVWLARFGTNELLPGGPAPTEPDLGELVRRGAGLAADLLRSARQRPNIRVDVAVDLVTTVLRGMAADGLLRPGGGFASVDHHDFRDWLRRHGAAEATIDGGLVRGMYDLVFGYRDADHTRPAFSAGLGVFLAVRMFLDYKGAIFWKMTAGMGDVVFAPLHQALRRRGVGIRYFHRLEGLRLSPDGARLAAVDLVRQAPAEVAEEYEPLERFGGLPCFPWRPRLGPAAPSDREPTEHDPLTLDGEAVSLVCGVDVDDVVLAVGLGALPIVAADIVRAHPRWQAMIEHVRTVPTRSAQLWLRDDEPSLGWAHPGATVSGLEAPFDTVASMTHLLPAEGWSDAGADADADVPRSLAYLCSALPGGATDLASTTDEFLGEWSKALWPAGGPVGLEDAGVVAHHVSANTDPSDGYVQSLPGSGAHRLRADGSGVEGLVLAGDWIDCGLNAGCIEAAAIAGVQACAAVEGRPLSERVLGPLTWDRA
ncbi:MAG: FAD-dependent oxidoreductase [Acidimicrobiales bacterium]|nr:FAD-dependent oxidoreductase [Acidimicrobiales bacterium]